MTMSGTGSYLDVVNSPYDGTFEISSVAGATITKGADILKFPLANEPEAGCNYISSILHNKFY